jgi:prolyl-tRNA synthetase
MGDGKPFLVILRGCDELEEAKLGSLGFSLFRPATPEEIVPVMGAKPGSLGAIRSALADASVFAGIFADHAIRLVGNGTTGANKDGFHVRNVNVTRDLAVTLQVRRGIEVGHIFKLGTKYSEKFDAVYTDDQKQSHLMVMGCYGIGVSRTMQAVIEQSHDADGIVWPWNIAPFHVLICVLDPQLPEMMDLAKKLAAAAEGAGADVIIDDRAERPGVKFKDADLIGIPLRLTIGSKGLKDGIVEMKARAQKDVAKIPLAEIEAKLAAVVAEKRAAAAL